MPGLTVDITSTPDGYELIRSDGERFYLVATDKGHAVLYTGPQRSKPPSIGIVDFDVSISDKLAAARRWVLAYPRHPEMSD